MLSTQPYKGTRDFFPDEMRRQKWMFDRMRTAVESFGYQEYNGPMLEPFELYAAKTGEEIVNQQLYWLMDRGERKIAVRPEMTPTMARMVASKIHELPRPIRWFSLPNLWRYERPQRGRLREHWQLNVDVLGGDPILADAEILMLALNIMRAFGGESFVSIKVNSRRLMDQLFSDELGLSPEVTLATTKAVDARAKIGEEAYFKWLGELNLNAEQIQKMEQFFKLPFDEVAQAFPGQGTEELKSLFQMLAESGAGDKISFDPTVMRGLNYYTGTVFEMYDTSPENRRAMFGGGRYDNLIGLFGNHKLSGVGFGMGDVTLADFLATHGLLPTFESAIDVFVTLPKLEYRGHAEKIALILRENGLKVMTPLEVGSFGAQLKTANKHHAKFAVLLGEAEIAQGQVVVKNLVKGEQVTCDLAKVLEEITRSI